MTFSPNKTAIEIIKEDIYSGIDEKWYKSS